MQQKQYLVLQIHGSMKKQAKLLHCCNKYWLHNSWQSHCVENKSHTTGDPVFEKKFPS